MPDTSSTQPWSPRRLSPAAALWGLSAGEDAAGTPYVTRLRIRR